MKRVPGTLLRFASLVCALCWAGLIYYLSAQPSIEITPVFLHQDKFLHLSAYFILGLFTLGALRATAHGYSSNQLWLAITFAGAYGLLDEFHQSFVPGRNASVADGLADISGAILGAGLLFLLVRRYSAR